MNKCPTGLIAYRVPPILPVQLIEHNYRVVSHYDYNWRLMEFGINLVAK